MVLPPILNVTSTGPPRCSTIRQSEIASKRPSKGLSRCIEANVLDHPRPSLEAPILASNRCRTPWVSSTLKTGLVSIGSPDNRQREPCLRGCLRQTQIDAEHNGDLCRLLRCNRCSIIPLGSSNQHCAANAA